MDELEDLLVEFGILGDDKEFEHLIGKAAEETPDLALV
jgi:nitrogenase iron protein NifH